MVELYKTNYDCTGCTACEFICPTNAILMQYNKEGFLYPSIDQKKCINCKKCIKVCPLKEPVILDERLEVPLVYAVKHKSDKIRLNSSSGGIFTATTDKVIENDGVVYGASYGSDMEVIHKRTTTKNERNKLRGSKYVQSRLADTYNKIIDDLNDSKEVLFSGTPCQTAGLNNLLKMRKIDTLKLILVDIVCHGTPSPLIWHDYIEYLEKSRKQKILKYTFRDKNQGWRGYNIHVEYENKSSENNNEETRLYIKLYNTSKISRPCCYKCKFANTIRPSDLTIGDFWGIEDNIPKFEDSKGVSLLYVNTQKGYEVFNNISKELISVETSIVDSLQHNLVEPTPEPIDREAFWKDYRKKGFIVAGNKHSKNSLIRKVKNKIIRTFRNRKV